MTDADICMIVDAKAYATVLERRAYVFHSTSVCAGCGCSGDDFGSVSVEAFELTGDLYCEDCADDAIQDAMAVEDDLSCRMEGVS